MTGRVRFACVAFVLGLGACGPVPVHQAERNCMGDARAATGPRGEIGVGMVSDGHSVRPVGRLEMTISSDYAMGRDPAEVFTRCVMRQSGEMPTRPLYEQPGWAG